MTAAQTGAIDVRRASDRFHTRLPWLDSWHSFSFGEHHDPSNTHHGLLLVNNDDTVLPETGFGTHSHRDMEIVTWVLVGELEHRDSAGHHGVIRPGLAQRMSAGRGVAHSEHNPSASDPVHFVQMWVLPDTRGLEPSYEQQDVGAALEPGALVPVASGRGHDGAVSIHQRDAVLWCARLGAGDAIVTPGAPHVHVFVARGAVTLDGSDRLSAGDALRLTEAGEHTVTGTTDDTEILVWETA